MPLRRRGLGLATRGFVRRKPKWLWVRESGNVAVPGTNVNHDMMLDYRTNAGLTGNLPEFTVWRIHVKVSIFFSYSPATYSSSSGAFVGLFVDDVNTPLAAGGNAIAFEQQWLMWDILYAAEQEMMANNGVVGTPVLYHEYDIRARRVLRALKDTLWLNIAPVGNASFTNVAFTQSTLLRVRGT